MPYVALLRGINLGGHKLIKMDALRASCEALGLASVQTYIQSGNVVFKAAKQCAETLSAKLEKRIARDFGFPVTVLVRTAEEMGRVVKNNPFVKAKGIDTSRLHVTFLSGAPEEAALRALEALAVQPDEFRCSGREVYLYCPNGYAETKLSNNAIEKVLGVSATTRNWNTVNKLCALSLH